MTSLINFHDNYHFGKLPSGKIPSDYQLEDDCVVVICTKTKKKYHFKDLLVYNIPLEDTHEYQDAKAVIHNNLITLRVIADFAETTKVVFLCDSGINRSVFVMLSCMLLDYYPIFDLLEKYDKERKITRNRIILRNFVFKIILKDLDWSMMIHGTIEMNIFAPNEPRKKRRRTTSTEEDEDGAPKESRRRIDESR